MEEFLKAVSALNDETRVLILKFLSINNQSCVCEIEKSLNLSQSRLSRHLKILKESGFLDVKREGTWAFYSLNPKNSFCKKAIEEIVLLDIALPKSANSCDMKAS